MIDDACLSDTPEGRIATAACDGGSSKHLLPLAFGAIQDPGDYLGQHWEQCVPPSGWPVTVGILTLLPTSPGQVRVITHGGINVARVDDCHGRFDVILPCNVGNGRAGWVSIAIRDPGCNPCPCVGPPCYLPPSGTEPSTWGTIKSLYR